MRLSEGIEITRTPRIAAGLDYLKERVSAKFPNARFLETIRPEPLDFDLAIFVEVDEIEAARCHAIDALIDLIDQDFEDPLPILVSVFGPEPYDPTRHGQLYVEPASVVAALAD